MALDIIDWYRLWGDEPVSFDKWYQRLCPHLKEPSAQRTWLRTRQRLMKTKRYNAHVEISLNPLSFSGGLSVAIFYGGVRVAENYLDDVEAARRRKAKRRKEAHKAASRERSEILKQQQLMRGHASPLGEQKRKRKATVATTR
jgi:hypothetical protein